MTSHFSQVWGQPFVTAAQRPSSSGVSKRSVSSRFSDVVEFPAEAQIDGQSIIWLSKEQISSIENALFSALNAAREQFGASLHPGFILDPIKKIIGNDFSNAAKSDADSVYRRILPHNNFRSTVCVNCKFISKSLNRFLKKAAKRKVDNYNNFDFTSRDILCPILQQLKQSYSAVGLNIGGLELDQSDVRSYDRFSLILNLYDGYDISAARSNSGDSILNTPLQNKRLLWIQRRESVDNCNLTPPQFIRKNYSDLISQNLLTETELRKADSALFLAFYRWRRNNPHAPLGFTLLKRSEITASRYRDRYGPGGEQILNAIRRETRERVRRHYGQKAVPS